MWSSTRVKPPAAQVAPGFRVGGLFFARKDRTIREHYDLPSCSETPPRRPKNEEQERFDVLMGSFLSELSLNMEGIAEEFPTVGWSLRELAAFMVRHDGTAFRRVRPEILQETVRAGERVCPR